MGVRTACDGVKGYYPSFDITPPELVSGVVTDRGVYAANDLQRYFECRSGKTDGGLVV
jgi:methylthioribose-1-phosphate isomerase